MTPVVEITDLEVVYDRHGGPPVRAVVDASLSVGRGEIVGLVGESGCGKSTLARAAVGLVPATSGSIRLEGRPLEPLSRRTRPKADTRLQLVFQDPHASLNPRRRVGSQIADALVSLGRRSRRERAGRVAELLDQVGLPAGAASRFPHEFSGGQRQRIAIARALAAEPAALVLDEPLSSLDASAQAQIANLLVGLTRELDLGLLLISHDLAVVRQVADRVCVMYLGKVVEQAPTAALWAQPLHPYTAALIAAIPHADGRGFLPEALAGEVPDPARPPAGCRFHPRCPVAISRCADDVPAFERFAGDRDAACWLVRPNGSPEPATRTALP
jgi:oligopeptide/dipeptide ABC transporter ATP-binding protein